MIIRTICSLLGSHLCGHIELVELEFGTYQVFPRLVTDFMVPDDALP